MEPISAFLEVVDRVSQLLKHRQLRQEEFFDQIIKPLYESLPAAVDNLFDFLSETEKIIRSGDYDENAITHLREQRQKLLTSRIEIRSTAKEIAKQSGDVEYKHFAEGVAALFSSTEPNMREDFLYRTHSIPGAILDILDEEISHQARAEWEEKGPAQYRQKKLDQEDSQQTPVRRNKIAGYKVIKTSPPDFESSMFESIALSRKRLESRWQKVSESYAGLLQGRYC